MRVVTHDEARALVRTGVPVYAIVSREGAAILATITGADGFDAPPNGANIVDSAKGRDHTVAVADLRHTRRSAAYVDGRSRALREEAR